MLTTLLILLIIGVPTVWAICQNGLVAAREKVSEGWSGITVQLKRRHALVPNLVQAARSAMAHEEGIFERLLEARQTAAAALTAGAPEEIGAAEAALSAALSNFAGYAEDTPEITANENIKLLQKQLEETEDQIAAARRLYNGNVAAYNTKIDQIPWSFVAARGDFNKATLFEVSAAEMAKISQDISVADLGLGDRA